MQTPERHESISTIRPQTFIPECPFDDDNPLESLFLNVVAAFDDYGVDSVEAKEMRQIMWDYIDSLKEQEEAANVM